MVYCGAQEYDAIIIGTGIAGSVLAYHLEKTGLDYMICTEKQSALQNTSSLSFGHCRMPKESELEKTIEISVAKLGQDEERLRKVYSNTGIVFETFEELGIPYSQRSFGIVPSCSCSKRCRGGKVILEAIQSRLSNIYPRTEIEDFAKIEEGFLVSLNVMGMEYKCATKNLVLAFGGYGGKYRHNDCCSYDNSEIPGIVKKNGGKIVNMGSIFRHPFGYDKGRQILIGPEVRKGRFVDENGCAFFDDETQEMIRNNDYHENFDKVLRQMKECRKKGLKTYFVIGERKIEIMPTVHYTSGGIKTDAVGEAIGCAGLYAIGECAAEGLRNGGRLPGYPFTSAIVRGKMLAEILVQKSHGGGKMEEQQIRMHIKKNI